MSFTMKMWCSVSSDEWEATIEEPSGQCPSACPGGCQINIDHTIVILTGNGQMGVEGTDWEYAIASTYVDNGDGTRTYHRATFSGGSWTDHGELVR